jgi:ubiquinone/menaquinone biosynthesis C-methylase UbiE
MIQENEIICSNCSIKYPIRDDIPVLIDLRRKREVSGIDQSHFRVNMLEKGKSDVSPDDWNTVEWEVFDNRAERRMKKLLEYVPLSGCHLDVGCGRGDGSALVGKMKPTIAIDYGSKSTRVAKKRHRDVIQADGAELPFPDNYFSSITCLDVLEHILEPELALKEIHRSLTLDGVFILQTPTLEADKIKAIGRALYRIQISPLSILRRVKRFLMRERVSFRRPPQPIEVIRSEKYVENLIKNCGFEIVNYRKIRYWSEHKIIWLFAFASLWVLRRSK